LWETFALYAVLPDPIYILKRELMLIPLFGWYAWKARLIPVDRSAGLSALTKMTARARQELQRGCQLVIFPEGTRRPPGAEPVYKPGIAFLYSQTNVPCVPIALNSGLFWPRRSLRRRPGTILVQTLPPIPPGLDRKVFFARLQSVLEEATTKLVQESGQESGAGNG
jgi:1-acyl-sn-glycerol-3-phosphate acyltransferase